MLAARSGVFTQPLLVVVYSVRYMFDSVIVAMFCARPMAKYGFGLGPRVQLLRLKVQCVCQISAAVRFARGKRYGRHFTCAVQESSQGPVVSLPPQAIVQGRSVHHADDDHRRKHDFELLSMPVDHPSYPDPCPEQLPSLFTLHARKCKSSEVQTECVQSAVCLQLVKPKAQPHTFTDPPKQMALGERHVLQAARRSSRR